MLLDNYQGCDVKLCLALHLSEDYFVSEFVANEFREMSAWK